jgi:hypothetical protein
MPMQVRVARVARVVRPVQPAQSARSVFHAESSGLASARRAESGNLLASAGCGLTIWADRALKLRGEDDAFEPAGLGWFPASRRLSHDPPLVG